MYHGWLGPYVTAKSSSPWLLGHRHLDEPCPNCPRSTAFKNIFLWWLIKRKWFGWGRYIRVPVPFVLPQKKTASHASQNTPSLPGLQRRQPRTIWRRYQQREQTSCHWSETIRGPAVQVCLPLRSSGRLGQDSTGSPRSQSQVPFVWPLHHATTLDHAHSLKLNLNLQQICNRIGNGNYS